MIRRHQGHGRVSQHRSRKGLFPTFFMAGFECSTFIWRDRKRKNYLSITGHDRHLADDYKCLFDLGVGVVREAIPWPFVDNSSQSYDWSWVDQVLELLEEYHLTPIWDLCHYGFPDNCDPFSPDCCGRFCDYARAVAERVARHTSPPRFFTPINEITFFSGAATDMGWMAPFAKGKYPEFKRALCNMAINGAKAIRQVDPEARMVHVDPIIHAVPPKDRPDLADEARKHAYEDAYEAWDVLFGKKFPELGGAPDILDIVGVNVYNFSQAQMNADNTREVLGPCDPRRKPLSEMLIYAWERYHRPLIIGETSGHQKHRAEWLRMTMEESMKAMNKGVDLHGVCLYPCIDIPDWQTDEWAKIGIFDIEDRDSCERIPCKSYIEELHRWQRLLDQPEHTEPDGFGKEWGRVQLEEVHEYARRWEKRKKTNKKVSARG